MQAIRHNIVLPRLSLLLIAGLTGPWLHMLSHVVHESYTPHNTERTGGALAWDTEGCELCVPNATLASIEFEAISISPAYAVHQHSALAPDLVHDIHAAPTDARAPPPTLSLS